MATMIRSRMLILAFALMLAIPAFASAQQVTSVDDSSQFQWRGEQVIVRVAKNPEQGFHYPYFLRIPAEPRADDLRLLVEPNNTGRATDEFEEHEAAARRLISRSYASSIADRLQVPMLIPVFPRPRSDWRAYTHSLDDDTLRISEGPNRRIDLQLIAMIKDAKKLLTANQLEVRDKILMHGYSASGTFTNRFAALHPDHVRAVASGGVNSIPLIPTDKVAGREIPYPIGLHEIKDLTGDRFDREAYLRVSQFIYMGAFDRNDTTEYRDAFSQEHADLIHALIGKAMPDRWQKCQELFAELEIPAQLVTYNATGHTIRAEMLDDIVRFFDANMGSERKTVTPHQYPYEEFKELTQVLVSGIYWRNSQELPEFARGLFDGQGTFAICIDDWIESLDRTQLDSFRKRNGFHFRLAQTDGAAIEITPENFLGTTSTGDGSFQAFVVALKPDQLEELEQGAYILQPLGDSTKGWRIGKDVQLVVPADK